METDYNNPDKIVQLLEKHNIDTVVSTTGTMSFDLTGELNLIEAAEKSSVTKRIIPSIWSGYEYKPEYVLSEPSPY